ALATGSRLSRAMPAAAAESVQLARRAEYSAPGPLLERAHWQAVPDLLSRAGLLAQAALRPAAVAAGWFPAPVAAWQGLSAVPAAMARSKVRQSTRYSGFS